MRVNPIITHGLGKGSMLITKGYGRITVIVPPEVVGRPPRLLRIPKETLEPLQKVGILKPFSLNVDLGHIDLSKLHRIRELIRQLEIELPQELRTTLFLLDVGKVKLPEVDTTRKLRKDLLYLDFQAFKKKLLERLADYTEIGELLESIEEEEG